jgi:plastocyanin
VFRASAERPRAGRLSALRGAPGAPGYTPPAGSDDGSAADPGTGSTPALGRFVSVSAREWSFTLSRPIVGAGSVTVELRNVGEDPHNLVVSPDDDSHTALASWSDTDPGARLRHTVSLDPGRYRLWCSLAGHEAAGMSATLVVE